MNKGGDIVLNTSLILLSEGKSIRVKAHGYSMFPSIKPGSMILIEPLMIKGPPRAGEIVAIRRESGLIVHRMVKTVVKNGMTMYIARGDSNYYADLPVGLDMIVGRITGAETTGENPVPADISRNTKPRYLYNRFRVIWMLLWKKRRHFSGNR